MTERRFEAIVSRLQTGEEIEVSVFGDNFYDAAKAAKEAAQAHFESKYPEFDGRMQLEKIFYAKPHWE